MYAPQSTRNNDTCQPRVVCPKVTGLREEPQNYLLCRTPPGLSARRNVGLLSDCGGPRYCVVVPTGWVNWVGVASMRLQDAEMGYYLNYESSFSFFSPKISLCIGPRPDLPTIPPQNAHLSAYADSKAII